MRVLAIDTALEACSACLYDSDTGEVLASESLAMARGHAEALVPMIDRVVGAVDGGFEALDRVGATVGPGSFTGLRVAISAGRAVALAANVPCVGVTTLAAYAAPLIAAGVGTLVASAIDARHGAVYFQAFGPAGRTIVTPRIVSVRDAARQLGSGTVRIAGSGASLLAAEARAIGLEAQVEGETPAPDILWVARLAAAASPAHAEPKPFYLRPPDAKPQDHVRVPRR
ncbi:tRNA (adenosine(37)-N6)-threonylcarbamoyltransferase complex dimerization subunit type 1 TsaB [Alsobacter sp. R-9]